MKYFIFQFLSKIFVGLFLTSNFLYAQACFTADKVRGCVPLTINVLNCSNAPTGALIAYKYNETEGFVPRTTNTYTTPGRYAITQIVQIGVSGDSLRRNNYIEVLATPPPQFQIKYCADRKVALTIPDNTYEQYIINWGDGSPLQTIPRGSPAIFHTYNTNAPASVVVTGNYLPGGCGGFNAQIVNPINAIPLPYIKTLTTTVRGVTNGKIDISLETDTNFQYEFIINGVSESTINGTGTLVTKSFENLNTENTTYCFSVKVKDNCGNELTTQNYYCALSLKVNVLNNKNRLEWNPYPTNNIPTGAFQQYVITRNGQPYQLINNINTHFYEDTDVICLVNYCYQVTAEFLSPLGTLNSISNQKCEQAFSTTPPPIVAHFNSTVETDRSIKIFWNVPNQPPITSFEIVRNGETKTFDNITQALLDSDLQINQQFCYNVRYTNACDQTSAFSGLTCPVFLSLAGYNQGDIVLKWTEYIHPDNNYESMVLEKLDETGSPYQSIPIPIGIITYTDEQARQDRQVMRYRIKIIINATQNIISYSNLIEVKQRFKLFFPNAFVPNGLNNQFLAKGLFIKKFKMTIYDRLGEIMFETQNIEQGWDGKYKGTDANIGTYVYIAEAEDAMGEKFKTQGTFTLIR
jgi:gliding motility-associated-like protein